MSEWRLFGRCFKCKRKRLLVMRREIKIPTGEMVKSRELFCARCFGEVLDAQKQGILN